MPPKAKASAENMKQKSLMGYFNKGSAEKPKPTPKLAGASRPKAANPATPEPNKAKIRDMASSSSVSSMGKDTPPTSDPIDVDMEDDARDKVRVRTGKRKIVYEESDEETLPSSATRGSASGPASSPLKSKGPAKKARLSVPLTDDDDEDDKVSVASFSKKLTHFKKPAAKKKSSRSSATSDDDDFIAPSDSEEETKSVKSRSSAASSDFDDDEDDDEPVSKKKSRPAAKKSASSTKATAASTSGGGSSFLTAAERRQQNKKDEKKATEAPYAFLQDIKDKDGNRPGQPNYDPRTIFVPKSAWSEFTPFEKQFWEIKQNHYDTILFFQKGKFYELYEDDARVGHQEFDLKLTQRVKMSMVGVPEMSFDFWAAKFLGKGHKVGKVDQAETALGAEMRIATDKGKGKAKATEKEKIVRRELHKVYTNGTLVDAEMLTDDQAGHCISIREVESEDGNHSFGICVLDCSTSQFELSVFKDDVCRTKLETLMRQARPKEMLFTKGQLSVTTTRLLKTFLPAACLWTGLREVEGFGYDATLKELRSLYPADDEEKMDEEGEEESLLPSSVPETIRGMADSEPAMEALGAMIWYLRQLNIDKDILSMKNFNIYDPMKQGPGGSAGGLVLDGQTLAHIEVLQNNEGGMEGSLLQLLGRCITPFGKRLFRIWVCMPLRDAVDINTRLDAVEDLMAHPTFEGEFSEIAKGLPDLERVVSRVHAKNCKVKDFLKVLSAFKKLSRGMTALANTSEGFDSKTIFGLLRGAPDLLPHIKNVESMYVQPNEKDTNELVPQKGKDKEFDAISKKIKQLEDGLDEELEEFAENTRLKLAWWHSAQGTKDIYLVETNASEKKGIPKDWVKAGGTKAKTRWRVESIQKSVRGLKEARETRNGVMKAFKNRVFEEFDTDRAVWLRAIRVFAELDCLFSLTKASNVLEEPKCRPVFVEAGPSGAAFVDFEGLRHPTVSSSVKSFIPNDVRLGGEVPRVALLTGPNMAGKSTVMRMTAAGIIMAQLGMYVPATSARLSPVDSILTRMGAYDNMFSNASTFKVELDECCKILRDATPRSFVILDELGRGTSTFDGMAIAGAVLHELATHTLPLTFFATHYGSMTDDFKYHPNIRNMYMSNIVDNEKRDIVFLYKLVDGVATSSFGTHVAKLAGVPFNVVERADIISQKFAEQFRERMERKEEKRRLPLGVQADFAYLVGVATGKVDNGRGGGADPESEEGQQKQRLVLEGMKETLKRYLKRAKEERRIQEQK